MRDVEPLILERLIEFGRTEARLVVMSIALLVPTFAILGIAAAFSEEGPRPPLRLAIASLIFATTVPVGLAMTRLAPGRIWWQTPVSLLRAEVGFIVYADLGVGGVLFTFVDHETALYGTVLFALIGGYASHFAAARVVIGHVVLTSTIVVVLGVLAWRQGEHDAAGVMARCLTSLVVISSSAALIFVFTSELRQILSRQFDDAARDPLTGLLNRRGFAALFEDFIVRERAVSLIVLDVDDFKRVNDQFGHSTGDEVLKLLGDRLKRSAGAAAFVARTGGEEFAVAFRQDKGDSFAQANRIRNAISVPTDLIPVTVSIGICHLLVDQMPRSHPATPAQIFRDALWTADAAMYDAKAAGGNRVAARLPSSTLP